MASMYFLTQRGALVCDHGGPIPAVASQSLVRAAGDAVLVEPDPIGKAVACPRQAAQIGQSPCMTTFDVSAGYSSWIRIDGRAVCLATIAGHTAAPDRPGYSVASAGQSLVEDLTG